MRTTHSLSSCPWRLSGWSPYLWQFARSMETGIAHQAEHPPIEASVPGSVQAALRGAGLIPDWNHGLNTRQCEWVENRHWIYETDIPDEWLAPGANVRLRAMGLDYSGWVYVNGREAGRFVGTFLPHTFNLTPHLKESGNRLFIVFDCPPRWLGQSGYTSEMTEWKPRFNYTWDWTARLVQIGVWDDLRLDVVDGPELGAVRIETGVEDGRGTLAFRSEGDGPAAGTVRVALERDGEVVRAEEVSAGDFGQGIAWAGLPVDLWWPNGEGEQPLYTLRVTLRDESGTAHDEMVCRVGFHRVEWQPCEGAPDGADPWLCVVNGRPVFLQGVNWTPIRPNFADVPDDEYRKRLELYRDLGMNVLRVWGGAFLEKPVFYDICDELGLFVWQEFPLSSSGIDNWPPEHPTAIAEMAEIARSYVRRRRHHASLLLWCGGNELQGDLDGSKTGGGKPCDLSHPMLARIGEVVSEEDASHRYLPTSSSGPRFTADEKDFGKGLHWDVHGPWLPEGDLLGAWARYWQNDDALFRSETGSPGASPADIIREYRGECDDIPGTADNPLWRRTSWWIEWPYCATELGREPKSLEEYVAWSQARQAQALATAARACKARFPACGGFILWMGHDSFPCTANTAIVDFHARPKPAALALADIFRARPNSD